ncbi:hypothetical protein VSQ32_10180 [Lachnospiraceae bacterium KK002]
MGFDEIWYTIKDIEKALKKAVSCSENIPERFKSNLFVETIKLIKEIKKTNEKPLKNVYIQILRNTSIIKTSMQCIALRFNPEHLRLLYEIEGIADY